MSINARTADDIFTPLKCMGFDYLNFTNLEHAYKKRAPYLAALLHEWLKEQSF